MRLPHFIDTNILLYSISSDPADRAKRDRACSLLDDDGGALSVQVLQEFYVQATRVSRPDPLPHHIAAGLIDAWTRFTVQETTLELVVLALEIKAHHSLSYWDSAIVAAASSVGCDVLYSEDMRHGQRIDRVTIVDPFR